MSILAGQVVSAGMIFGADRNVTTTSIEVTQGGRIVNVVHGQSQRPKVLRWPNNRALVGFVGVAEIEGRPIDEWIYDFIGRNIYFNSLEELAANLSDEVENHRRNDEGNEPAEGLLIHIGGFENRNNNWVPVIWFIRNIYALVDGRYEDIRKEYQYSEELWQRKYVGNANEENIRQWLAEHPVWLRQGIDLPTFNILDGYLMNGFEYLAQNHPSHNRPTTLEEFECHVRMSILTYEAYFEAFKGPGEQYVGGGVDTVKLAWPL